MSNQNQLLAYSQLTSLGILGGLSLELLKRLIVLGFNLALHFSQLNLVVVFGLSDDILLLTTSCVPLHEFELVDDLFLLDLVHRVEVFLELVDLGLAVLKLARCLSLKTRDVCFHLPDHLILGLPCFASELLDFGLELHQLPVLCIVLLVQLLANCLLLFDLCLKLLDETVVLGAPIACSVTE